MENYSHDLKKQNRRKNFSTLSRTSPLRGKTAREIRKLGEEEWNRVHEYGKHWTVEIYFS